MFPAEQNARDGGSHTGRDSSRLSCGRGIRQMPPRREDRLDPPLRDGGKCRACAVLGTLCTRDRFRGGTIGTPDEVSQLVSRHVRRLAQYLHDFHN